MVINIKNDNNDFLHCIMSYDRVDELKAVIDSILQLSTNASVCVYDSGGRPQVATLCKSRNIRYQDSSTAKTGFQNFKSIIKNEKKKIFIHHDDDPVSNEILILKHIILKQKICFATSLKEQDSKFNLGSLSRRIDKIEKLLNFYFLDPKGNCPLFSGLYIDNQKDWSFDPQFDFSGRHGDVGVILDLMTRDNSYIHSIPHIQYRDDIAGENSIKNHEDRRELSRFLNRLGGERAELYSLLAVAMGPRPTGYLSAIITQLIKHPDTIPPLIRKVFYKFINF